MDSRRKSIMSCRYGFRHKVFSVRIILGEKLSSVMKEKTRWKASWNKKKAASSFRKYLDITE